MNGKCQPYDDRLTRRTGDFAAGAGGTSSPDLAICGWSKLAHAAADAPKITGRIVRRTLRVTGGAAAAHKAGVRIPAGSVRPPGGSRAGACYRPSLEMVFSIISAR